VPRLAYTSDSSPETERLPSSSRSAHAQRRHAAAVAQSLRWAEESARCGDLGDALAWLTVIEATGDQLGHEYQSKRREWLAAVGARSNLGAP
jgi:hypothetical protein